MIPILYGREETLFNTNGIGRLADCISFTVTEERNGIYEAEFKYPMTGLHYDDIEEGMIVYAIHDDTKTPQPFRIYGRSAPISGMVTFYAHHISYDLGGIILTPFAASSCAAALAAMKDNTATYNPFTFWTNKSVSAPYIIRKPVSVKAMLGGTAGSILDVYGTGEYEFDKWNVKLYSSRGTNTGIRIQYGKNLSNIKQDTDYSQLYSAVAPFWQDATDASNVVTLPEYFITASQSLAAYAEWTDEDQTPITDQNGTVIDFEYGQLVIAPMDLTAEFQDEPTRDQLRTKAQALLEQSQAWLPKDNITVNFVQLWQTPEYASVAPLERLSLCDTVDVYYPELGIVAKNKKIIRVVYDVLLERYSSMEIGTAKVSFAQTVQASAEQVAVQKSKDMMTDAIANATAQITGEHGGYIKYIYDADGNSTDLLIMDAPDQAQAVKIWRWNLNGLGYSSNGGSTYGLAMTQDGAIVADYITAGTLNANLIKTGVISDEAGKYSLNMTTGAITMNDATLNRATVNGDIRSIVQDGAYWKMARMTSGGVVFFVSTDGNLYSSVYSMRPSYDGTYYDGNIGISWGDPNTRALILQGGQSGVGGMIYLGKNATLMNALVGHSCVVYISGQTYVDGSMTVRNDLNVVNIKTVDTLTFSNGVYIQKEGTGNSALVYVNKTFQIRGGNFSCTGTKSRAVDTDGFGTRALYCYETPSPLFGDVGEGTIGDDGTCYVWIDPIFAETIRTTSYQVFLQKYGDGDVYVSERKPGYFIVMGTPGMAFGWELKAKQSDFAEKRLEKDMGAADVGQSTDYGQQAADYLEELRSGRLAA